ncbi:MAG: beta-N-acetylglucosaminidase domain-containing protein, partial [Selenomonadaceae bacterium]|nr:beta-N-acetylglucosaminidase domain-containing protein [Selenomonadaceae bacterium]
MKFFRLTFLVMLMTLIFTNAALAYPIPLRGIVEGFYGETWTFEDRADLMAFCRENNLNA